jgi:hypothetical protein
MPVTGGKWDVATVRASEMLRYCAKVETCLYRGYVKMLPYLGNSL